MTNDTGAAMQGILAAALLLGGCARRDLEGYWTGLVARSQASVAGITCEASGRLGACRFSAASDEVEKIVRVWELKESTGAAAAGMCADFDRPGVRRYVETKELPPIYEGNNSSSFQALYHDPKTDRGCADLYFPYG